MAGNNARLLDALTKINQVVDDALGYADMDGDAGGGHDHEHDEAVEALSCVPKALPERLQVKAAEVAFYLNPANAPAVAAFARTTENFQPLEPLKIAVLTSKYWGARSRRLTVSFMETTPADLRRRIVSHLNAWSRTCGISFAETSGTGTIRISRGSGGYYSYLGTDVLLIPTNRQTMNLQGFTMNTSESEFKRVVRHEAGHTLGFPHEHMRRALVSLIDPAKAYDYFLRTQGWDRATVDAQVLTSLDERSLMATPADQTSIMCYQLPGSITRNGRPILGGIDINASDAAFAGRIYPKPGASPAMPSDQEGGCASAPVSEEWDESEDVDFSESVAEYA